MNRCEETSVVVCSEFPSAICFHCNHRLCLTHITEHNRLISHVNNLSNEIQLTSQQIDEESDKRKEIFNNILISFHQWRSEQIEQIDQIYRNHLQMIEKQREDLAQAEMNLFKQLKFQTRELQQQQQRGGEDLNMELIDQIDRTNKQIREENKYLKWKLTTTIPPPISPSNPPVMVVVSNKSNPHRGRPFKRLIQLFTNTSSIEQAKKDIHISIKKLSSQLPIIICSYLTAWYTKSPIDEKIFLLNEHITTIERYLCNNCDFLIGIQAFFHNQPIEENKSEMMTFLLQFFLNHQCITRNQILQWHEQDTNGYKGFHLAKQLAIPFLSSLTDLK